MHRFKVENNFQGVYDGNDHHKSHGYEPHITRFISLLMWRNFVELTEAKVLYIMAWLQTLRHIPNDEMGNRKRKGHVL